MTSQGHPLRLGLGLLAGAAGILAACAAAEWTLQALLEQVYQLIQSQFIRGVPRL